MIFKDLWATIRNVVEDLYGFLIFIVYIFWTTILGIVVAAAVNQPNIVIIGLILNVLWVLYKAFEVW